MENLSMASSAQRSGLFWSSNGIPGPTEKALRRGEGSLFRPVFGENLQGRERVLRPHLSRRHLLLEIFGIHSNRQEETLCQHVQPVPFGKEACEKGKEG